MEWDNDAPLTRAKGESRRANQALHDYALMGAGRSLRLLRGHYANAPQTESPPTRRWSTICGWSARYDWQARVARWEELEKERVTQQWRDRQDEIREREWGAAEALLERAAQMLKYPLSEQTVTREEAGPDGKAVVQHVTVKPVRWSQRDVAAFHKTASELARLAAEMETERKAREISGPGGGPIPIGMEDVLRALPNEFRAAVRAELDKLLRGRDGDTGAQGD